MRYICYNAFEKKEVTHTYKTLFEEEEDFTLDRLCKSALRFWLKETNGKASICSLQRGMGVGFDRAGRIFDSLQQLGYIEKKNDIYDSRPLQVFVTLDELDRLFPDMK